MMSQRVGAAWRRAVSATVIVGVCVTGTTWPVSLRAEAVPPENASVLQSLEAIIGSQLPARKGQQVEDAEKRVAADLRACGDQFLQRLVRATGITLQQAREAMPTNADPDAAFDKACTGKVGAILKRNLRPDELAQIRSADLMRKKAMAPVQDAFFKSLSGITGLSASQLKVLLPRFWVPAPDAPSAAPQ